jgi:hypothetical protein
MFCGLAGAAGMKRGRDSRQRQRGYVPQQRKKQQQFSSQTIHCFLNQNIDQPTRAMDEA